MKTKEEKIIKKEKSVKTDEKQESNIKNIIKEVPTGFNIYEVLIIIGIALLFGVLIGCTINFNGKIVPNGNTNIISKDLKELESTYNNIIENYYDNINKKELMDAAIKGMVDYLGDPYSDFMDQEQSQAFNELVEGKYTGIGCEITMSWDGIATIKKPYDNSPSQKAGLEIGDIILAVDDKVIENMTANELANLVRGKSGTKVIIKIKRKEEVKEITIERGTINIESVTSNIYEMNDKKIGYINIEIFAGNTFKQFETKLKDLESKKIDKLIIDVRDNGGGYLTTVSEILSMFMDKSKVLYQLDTKGKKETIYSFTKEKRNIEVAVLINQVSASASEILAGAFKESYGAHIIGVNTFGKGTVQKTYDLGEGKIIKYTVQKWLTPNGNWIDKLGIEPTIKVEMDLSPQTEEVDEQLQRAILELSK
ncbi:MAG: S41 family peptidase [Bacilli bacterium]